MTPQFNRPKLVNKIITKTTATATAFTTLIVKLATLTDEEIVEHYKKLKNV